MDSLSERIVHFVGTVVLESFPGFFLGITVGFLQCCLFFVLELPESSFVIGTMMFTSITVSGLLCEFARRFMSSE